MVSGTARGEENAGRDGTQALMAGKQGQGEGTYRNKEDGGGHD